MCGVFGIVTRKEENLGPILIQAGEWLSYRGYDSVGCATIDHAGKIDLRKDVGKVGDVAERLSFSEMTGNRGILQLRWATFGNPSQVNAQPHLDSDGDLVGAHNGNVVNNLELRQQFIAEGMKVRSQNDGESCVHAVERYIDRGEEMEAAIASAYQDLAGDYTFVIGQVGKDTLHALKKGSGLVVGLGDGFTCVSSDLPSILPLTRTILRINDGEMVSFTHNRATIRRVTDLEVLERLPEQVTESMDTAQKGGYDHFMLKEIHEQPAVARDLLHMLNSSPAIESIVQRLAKARHIYLVGCGTSYHASMLGAVYFAQLAGRAAIPVLAPQFIAQYGPTLTDQDVGIFVSQSGETKDVLNAIDVAAHHQMPILGLVNVIGSTLMRVSEFHIPLTCGYEISVPATKTFTNQVIAFLYLAMRLGGQDTSGLDRISELMEQTITTSETQIAAFHKRISASDDLYCLGYGYTYPIALEGALKLKEITYAHCEGMLSTEFKHGPLSAVSQDYPIIFVAGSRDVPLIVSGINEVTCRGARAIVIGEFDSRLEANAHHLITLPEASPYINALLAVIPLQLLSYHLSLDRGFNPDFPRNLSKTLTVD